MEAVCLPTPSFFSMDRIVIDTEGRVSKLVVVRVDARRNVIDTILDNLFPIH